MKQRSFPPDAPHYVLDGEHYFVLDRSFLGRKYARLRDGPHHLLGVIGRDGSQRSLIASPEFVADLIRRGDRVS
jgi:hypothetical protein